MNTNKRKLSEEQEEMLLAIEKQIQYNRGEPEETAVVYPPGYEDISLEANQVLLPVGYRTKDGLVHRIATFREIIGRDEQEAAKNKNNGVKFITAILGCVQFIDDIKVTPQILRQLTIADRDELLRAVSIFTFDSTERMYEDRCKYCKSLNSIYVDIKNDIKVTYLPDDTSTDIPISIDPPLVLDDEEIREAVLRLSIGADAEVLAPLAEKNMGEANTALLRIVTKQLGDRKVMTNDVFSKMSLKYRQYFAKKLKELSPGPKMEVLVDCPNCGNSFISPIPASAFLSE